MSTLTIPVLGKDDKKQGLSGVVEGANSNFDNEGVVAISNEKHQTGLPEVKSLVSHGVKVSGKTFVEYLVPELMCSSPTTTKLRPMTLFVSSLGGKHVSICCMSTDTVACVKTRIEGKEGIPCKAQRLVYAGKQLQDCFSLSDYDIGDAATLRLNLRLLGGSPGELAPRKFADVSNGSILIPTDFSPTAPQWRQVTKGLNVEGRCTNGVCRAFGQLVIDQKGFEWFNIVGDDNVKCPICGCFVKPVTCGFYDCSWTFEGVKKNDELPISSPWKDANGYVYHLFHADESNGSVEWASFALVARPKN